MKRRTLVRGVVLAGLLLVLGLLVAYSATSAWARKRWAESSARFEREVGTLALRKWELPEVPDERNAATWIAKGSAALILKREKGVSATVSSLVKKRPEEWAVAEIAALRDTVALNSDALTILSRARGLDDSSFGIRLRDGVGAKIPNLLEIINAAKLVYARGNLAIRDGDRNSAISDSALLGVMSRALVREHSLIVVQIGIAIEKYQLSLVHAVIEDPALTPDEARAAVAVILRDDVRRAFANSLASDAAVVCTAYRRATDETFQPYSRHHVPRAFRIAQPVAGDAFAAYCLDSYREVSGVLLAPVLKVDTRLNEAQSGLGGNWVSRLVRKLVIPNLLNGSERAWINLELRRLTLAAASLREQAWKEKAYPGDLGGLPPSAMPDPDGTGPWTYERLPDGSARLSAPGAAALAEKVLIAPRADTLPFRWTLPPPR